MSPEIKKKEKRGFLDLLGLKRGINDFAEAYQDNLKETEALKQQRDDLENLPLPCEDLKMQICAMVDKQGQEYPKRLAQALGGLLHKPFYDYENSCIELVTSTGGGSVQGQIPKQNTYWFFNKLIKDGLCRAIDEMPYPECGLPLAERKPLIAKLDKQIAKLEEEASELRQAADQAGLRVERFT